MKRQHKVLLQPFQKSLSLTMVTPTYLWMVMDQTSVNSSCCLSTLTPFVSFKCDMLVENGYTMWGIFTKAWTYVIVLIKLLNCRVSLSHHHQNYSTNKVKNLRSIKEDDSFLAKIQVCAMFYVGGIQRNVFVLLKGTNMLARS